MNFLEIKTIKGQKGDEVSFCPSRGGIITSLKLKGKEVFYFDAETFNKESISVRGGMPILFPNAGEIIENKILPNLKRHGFARDMEWKNMDCTDGFAEELFSTKETLEKYPYDFKLRVSGEFENEDTFVISEDIINLEEGKEMPISIGLHPYFRVSHEEKNKVEFNFIGGKEIEEKVEIWGNGGTVSIDNPKIKNPDGLLEIVMPDLSKIIMDVSTEYKKIWVWSEPGKDFVCIEPVMRDEGGIIDNPLLIKPKESFHSSLKISLI